MSLSNLGKNISSAKEIVDMFAGLSNITSGPAFDIGELIINAESKAKGLFNSMSGLDDAIIAFKKLGIEGDELAVILARCGVNTDAIEAAMKKASKTSTSFVGRIKTGFDGLAKSIGLTSKSLLGWIGGITAAVAVFTILSNVQKKMYENAQQGAETYKEQTASLEAYKAEIAQLKSSLDSGNLSEQEAYEVRSRLLSIQDELVAGFGSEAKSLDLLTASADTAAAALDRLNAASAEDYLTKNSSTIKNAERALESVNEYRVRSMNWNLSSKYDDVKRQIADIVRQYDAARLDIQRDVFGNESIANIVVEADAEEARATLSSLASDFRDLQNELKADGINLDDIIQVGTFDYSFESLINGIDNVIDKYSDIYETANLAKIADTDVYSKLMSEMEDAQNAYNEAMIGTYDTEEQRAAAVASAIEKMTAAKQAFSEMDFGDDLGVQEIFSKMVEEFNDAILHNQLRLDIKATVNGTSPTEAGNDIVEALKAFEDANGNVDPYSIKNAGLGSEKWGTDGRRLLSELSAQERAYLNLKSIFEQSNMTLDEGIALLQEMGLIQKTVADGAEETAKAYSDMATAVSGLKSEFNALNSAASEQGYSGNISPETYDALIAKSKDYAACIEYQNGALQLNTEKANALFEAKSELQIAELELQKIADATKWKENADEIARLTRGYDGLDGTVKDRIDSLKKENDGIEANLVGYDLQIAAIEELTSAYGRWKAVSESDNSDSMYKDIQKAYEAIKEAQKTGQTGVGNVVYQAAVELLVPEGEDVKKYMSTLQKYIMDGSNGLSNFINDMVTNELMDRSGSEVKMKMGVTMEQICNTMKITPDMAKAIFNALEMYDFDFHWTDEDFNINTDDAMAELKAAQEEMNNTIATINKMKEAGATGLSMDALEKQYAEQKSQYDKLLSSVTGNPEDNTVEYTVTANTSEAEKTLGTISEKLDEIANKIQELAGKIIGTFGAFSTLSILGSVYDRLVEINDYKIADKSFTTYNHVKTVGGSSSSTDGAIPLASGTRSAKQGVALLGDEYSPDGSPKPELVITDGAAYVAGQGGPEFVNLNEGDRVIPADETEKILRGNPKVERGIVPAFATGAGGYPAGSVQEDKYLEGVIGPDPTWLKQREEQKKKDDELIKRLSQEAAEKSADDGYLNYVASTGALVKTSVSVDGGGDTSSLKNPGGSGGSGSGGSSGSSSSSKKEKSQFEKEYEHRKHLLAMEKIDYANYIDWLEDAYKEAYEKGEIELEDFYKYEEEVFNAQKELFQDSINDIEHKIKMLERNPKNETQIIEYYNQIIDKIDSEIAAARARGLDDNDDYIQELLEQRWGYADEISDIQDEISENAKDAFDELVDYRIEMLKQDLENEKDVITEKLDTLKDFYDKQKEMLQDVYDEEKYLEEQSEKRNTVDEIRAEMDMLRFDNSAKAQKRLNELQEELREAEKELSNFEKDHALENATDLLDRMYEHQETQIEAEIEAIDARLNDPDALFNQALRDIRSNTLALYEEMLEYNNRYGSGDDSEIFDLWNNADEALEAYLRVFGQTFNGTSLVDVFRPTGYANGTSNATPGIHELFEGDKDEYVLETSDGHRYKMFSGLGKKVLNASATDFLYKFANNGESFISNMLNGLVSAIGNVGKPTQQIQLSTGDIIVQGNASADTISAIRRAQRENVDYILREFQRLNR